MSPVGYPPLLPRRNARRMAVNREQPRLLASRPYLAAALAASLLVGAACASGALPSPTPAVQTPDVPRPPLTPRWVYEPWVWEDEEHTAPAVLNLVDEPTGRAITRSQPRP